MKGPANEKSVGIWIRVSTEDQAKGESPEHHERRARMYAEAKGWRVREVYHLEAISGKSVMGLPETQRMLGHIRSGHISALIFSKLARLARNTRELLEFSDIFREHNADLISLQESIDTSTPAGRLFYTVIAAMAQWEREEISDRVAASVPIRAKMGKPLGGAAPFGYQWVGRELKPDPKEAPVRRLIYEMFEKHRRKKTVARLLNEQGHRTRNGSKFTDTTIERLLRDPTAKGIRRANYTKSLGEGKRWVFKPEDQWVTSQVESIVPAELWDRCNLMLDDRRKNGKRPAKKPVQLFTGLTFCHCGQKMYVPSNMPKYVCYRCRNKIPVESLDGIFHQQLKDFFICPTQIVGYLQQADVVIREKQQLLENLKQEYDQLRTGMDKLFKLYYADKITADGFADQNKPLEERKKQLEDQLPQLQAEVDFLKIQHLSSDQILTEARDLFTRWPSLDFEEKRRIVENVTERITIGKTEVEINLCYLPSLEDVADKQRNFTDSSRRPA